MRGARWIPVSFAMGLLACAPADTSAPVVTPEPTKNEVAFTTPEFDVPPGDAFECFYTDTITDKELTVLKGVGQQGPGGHHIIVYYTDTKRAPEHHVCKDSEMVAWHQIVGVSGKENGEPVISFPEGVALKVPAGKQLVMQTHYINTTGATMKTTDHVALELGDPKDVKAYTNLFAINNAEFQVDPNQKATASSVCTLNRDIDYIVMGGHMHEFGSHFTIDRLDAAGMLTETIYDKAWKPEYSSHPPMLQYPLDKPLHLLKGTKIRSTCAWDNTTPNTLAFPREMCAVFSYYVPDAGEIVCDLDPAPAP